MKVNATDDPAELGPQDVVFITLKTHQYLAVLDKVLPLLGPETALIPPTTGAPYWFFHKLGGPFEGSRLKRMDPGGRQWSMFGPERALGCAYWAGGVVPAPGVAHLENEVCYLPLGEPDGSASPRVTALSAGMNEAGLKAPVKSDIRAEIWSKMINSLTWNPIAVLTLADNGGIGCSPGAVDIARRMMTEAEAVAAKFGATMATPMEKRIEFTVGLGDPQDVDADRPSVRQAARDRRTGRFDRRPQRTGRHRDADHRHDAVAAEAAGGAGLSHSIVSSGTLRILRCAPGRGLPHPR